LKSIIWKAGSFSQRTLGAVKGTFLNKNLRLYNTGKVGEEK